MIDAEDFKRIEEDQESSPNEIQRNPNEKSNFVNILNKMCSLRI
jgi:hypothetical protein